MGNEEYICPLVMVCGAYIDASECGKLNAARRAVIKRNEGKYFCERMPTSGLGNCKITDTSDLPECALVAILNKLEVISDII